VNLELRLALGAVSQEVTVIAAPALLQSEKADVNVVLPEQTIRELPVISRNVTRLHLLAPGVAEFNSQQGPGENPSLGATVTTNGQFWGSNEYQIDGITDIEFGSTGMQMITPNMDSVQEMKVTTSTYDAELGQVSGLVAQYVTKSGTNDTHGSAFWYNRNKATFAADPLTEKYRGPDPAGTAPVRRLSTSTSSVEASAARSSKIRCSSSAITRAIGRGRGRRNWRPFLRRTSSQAT
jgi:hypothetical protein